ncbi:MAG: hypothetical protein GY854_17430 [Deltaproteobacteria bacterium]|nr:hypothetical protein [Deltaproteobacteria bacterium]
MVTEWLGYLVQKGEMETGRQMQRMFFCGMIFCVVHGICDDGLADEAAARTAFYEGKTHFNQGEYEAAAAG